MSNVKATDQFPIDLRCRLWNPRNPLTILVNKLKDIKEEKGTAKAIQEVYGGSMPPDEFFKLRK